MTTKNGHKPAPPARVGARAVRRRLQREQAKTIDIPGVTVLGPGQEPEPDPNVVFLDEEDCVLIAHLAMQTQGVQLHVGALMKGLGKDRAVERRLVIFGAALMPTHPTEKRGLDPAQPVVMDAAGS